MSIKPIETRYRGYRFRSRTEARWAVFFDALGLAWIYEKEGYDLPELGYYLPDFWLPYFRAWVEIKGEEPTPIELKRCETLAQATNMAAMLFNGLPGDDWGRLYCQDYTDSSGGWCDWEVQFCDHLHMPDCWLAVKDDHSDREFFSGDKPLPVVRLGKNKPLWIGPMTERAIEAARAARFEHNEKPPCSKPTSARRL